MPQSIHNFFCWCLKVQVILQVAKVQISKIADFCTQKALFMLKSHFLYNIFSDKIKVCFSYLRCHILVESLKRIFFFRCNYPLHWAPYFLFQFYFVALFSFWQRMLIVFPCIVNWYSTFTSMPSCPATSTSRASITSFTLVGLTLEAMWSFHVHGIEAPPPVCLSLTQVGKPGGRLLYSGLPVTNLK